MKDSGHEFLAYRLTAILQRLSSGDKLHIEDLADEFGVCRRTIQRDLNGRFAFLPIEQRDGAYSMDPAFLGGIPFRDIQRFAALAGLAGLFPALDSQFFRELLDSRRPNVFAIQGASHEDLGTKHHEFRCLQTAIQKQQHVRFRYLKEHETKLVEAEPYRLMNHQGIWYLAAVNGGKPKSYALSKIEAISILATTFAPDPAVSQMLDDEDSIWLNQNKTKVTLTVAAPVAAYFKRRKLISFQVIEKENEDGSLIVTGQFAHPNQILPIVRYWLPHVRIVQPIEWQAEQERTLREYLSMSAAP